jgi:hypothetical protein
MIEVPGKLSAAGGNTLKRPITDPLRTETGFAAFKQELTRGQRLTGATYEARFVYRPGRK